MHLDEFRKSLTADTPPPGLSLALQALWHDAQGNWSSAHENAQRDPSRAGAWVHAYLHRKEGDADNASYWYARAGRTASRGSLESEWEEIVRILLADDPHDNTG